MSVKNNLTANVFKIETFGAVDGPGLRLVIFMQGCDFRCKYCHNPESWSKKSYIAKQMSINDILDIYKRNKPFYITGGITLSGGEPMVQPKFVLEFAKACKCRKIHLTIDTSACNFISNNEIYEELIKYVDLWMVDIKGLNAKDHKFITGYSELTGIKFIDFLEKNKKEYWIRYVLVKDFNDTVNHLNKLATLVANKKFLTKYEILPYHNLALDKYIKLNVLYPFAKVEVMNTTEVEEFKTKLAKLIKKIKSV